MIVAVSSVKDEADIIGQTVDHLFKQGVDRIVLSDGGSTDSTIHELAPYAHCDVHHQEGPFDQGAEITRLAHLAADLGATWIVPFDADEFWVATDKTTIGDVLRQVPANIGRVFAAHYGHRDWTYRLNQKPLSKVCFRPHDLMRVHWGNHNVTGVPGDEVHGILEVRELQWRDWEHFLAKVEKARALFDSWDVPIEHGSHMRALTLLSTAELEGEWARIQAEPAVMDPIT